MADTTIGILGHGRFGRALADLLHECGLRVVAFDPVASVPEGRRVASPAELAAAADVVVVSVPLAGLAAATEGIAPQLGPGHLVIDVASVKSGPVAVLGRLLGPRVPWIATHPLFGPSSIAVGEKPLHAVICPNPVHPHSAARARALYERIGCHVVEQDAAEHDRIMARTHALAFFVAKGLLDAGAPGKSSCVPPSFRAMARTIEAVQSDAGHLFRTIECENPFAAASRQALLDALGRIHAELNTGTASDDEGETLEIPGLGARSPEERSPGELLEDCDAELVALLARRARLQRRAGDAGEPHGIPGERLQRSAREHGLDPAALAQVLRALASLRDI